MKLILHALSILTLAFLSSCADSAMSDDDSSGSNPDSGALFKEGQGISVSPLMAESIGLQITEVSEDANARVSVPRSALLTTVEGHFVYAGNGGFFLRTPVKIGTQSAEWVEIADGLYAGDKIVSAAVISLWLAELQYLRGGKACAD